MNELSAYSWDSIIEYIKTQKDLFEKEKESWNKERSTYLLMLQEKDQKILVLQAENKELLTKISILEYTSRQDSQRTQKFHQRNLSDQISSQNPQHLKFSSTERSQKFLSLHRPTSSYTGLLEGKSEPLSIPSIKQICEMKPILKKKWTPTVSLRSHFDCVRGLHFASPKILASASEDFTVKLWNCSSLGSEPENLEPYLTLRGHSGPIFAIDGGLGSIFTGDNNGIIHAWHVPTPEEVQEYPPYKSYCIAKWKAHNDSIWSVRCNAIDNAIISASSDSTIKLWKIPEDLSSNTPSHKVFSYPGLYNNPTVCSWVASNLKYITVGYSSFLTIFNVETSGFSKIPFVTETVNTAHQVNCISTSLNNSLTVTGHEDKRIRFFDLVSNNCIKDMVGHTDSVTDIWMDQSGFYLISTGHDGSLRSWDLRNYHCLHETTINRKKYDESIFCLAKHSECDLIAIGGADSIIKILEPKDN